MTSFQVNFDNEKLPYEEVGGELYDGWLDKQFEKLQMVYCVTCKMFVDANPPHDGHEGHTLAFTTGQKASEEVIERLSE